MIFHKDYWECMEHWEDGSPNPTGKEIRKKCKSIVLGISYGMGAKLLSSMIKVSVEECKEILNDFYKMFPTVLEFTKSNEKAAFERGYVEDYIGRRRHLPDASLPELEFRAKDTYFTKADEFIDCDQNDIQVDVYNPDESKQWEAKWKNYQTNQRAFRKSAFEVKTNFKKIASDSGVDVKDNGAFISRTMTQCTNSTIQGSAASLTKKAMVTIANDKDLNKMGFKLLVPVHDELLGEVPIIYREKAAERLVACMVGAAKPECSVDMKVDTYVVNHWYADDVSDQVNELYNKLLKDKSEDEAFKAIVDKYPNFTIDTLKEMCSGTFDVLKENI